ncbi:MAG TPA: DNA polymerase Y family protein [Burkholderiales bacterium]|nr:DNA polymerase Y family protein [Burkholderiales bacterium]
MLWTCLHFPSLPLQVLLRAAAVPGPLAVTSPGTRPQVLACNDAAAARGVHDGMPLPAALALAPELTVRTRDAAAEARALAGIAAWAGQFSSAVSLAPPAGVLLEIGSSLTLFGGADALLRNIDSGLAALGYRARIAVAPAPAAALLLARAGIETPVTDARDLQRQLDRVPIDLLDHPPEALQTLIDIGVASVGDCLRLPRDGLARRFGPALLDLLDRAAGGLPDPRPPFAVPERFSSRIELPAPVAEAQAALFAASRLLAEMCGWLACRALGALRIELELVHEDFAPTRIALELAHPGRGHAHLAALLRERLDRARLPGRVEALALACTAAAPLASSSLDLFANDTPAEPFVLIERLAARLGDDAICALAPYPDHRPERAYRIVRPGAVAAPAAVAPRPLWLLADPRPLDSRALAALALDGPERIESGWWDGADVSRDYFVARAAGGETLWIFRDRRDAGAWFLHGIFA